MSVYSNRAGRNSSGHSDEEPFEDSLQPNTNERYARIDEQNKSPLLSPVIWCILITETGERFSYFGFRAILVLWFVDLHYSESQSIAFFAYVTSLAYLTPLAGAILADGHLGRYRTILWFGLIYVLGLAILTYAALLDELEWKRLGTFFGLLLVCLGTGGIKPCVSAFGADQVAVNEEHTMEEDAQGKEHQITNEHCKEDLPVDVRDSTPHSRDEQVRTYFSYFYLCINLGALTSIMLVPIVRSAYGFGAAFLLPTLFMITAMLLFISKRKDYVHHQPGSSVISGTFRMCWWLLRQQLWSNPWIARNFPLWRPGPLSRQNLSLNDEQERASLRRESDDSFILNNSSNSHNSEDNASEQQLSDAAQALHVLPIMAMFPIFWSLYDQQSSVWTLQANRMNLHGLQPEQLNVVNPFEIMFFIPLFDRVIYPILDRSGVNIAPMRRMTWGMVLTAISFFISGYLESIVEYRQANELEKVSVFWQLPQITILAVGEIFFSVTGLEFAYATSPHRLKTFLMAVFLLTTAVGDLFSAILYSTIFADMNRATVMHVCALLMIGNLALFCWVVKWWEQHSVYEVQRFSSMEGLEFEQRS